jgi:hypothetical protein
VAGLVDLAFDFDCAALGGERLVVRGDVLQQAKAEAQVAAGLKYPQMVPVAGSNSVSY